jgi:hypothetical protein
MTEYEASNDYGSFYFSNTAGDPIRTVEYAYHHFLKEYMGMTMYDMVYY